jgi:hypothetical protein
MEVDDETARGELSNLDPWIYERGGARDEGTYKKKKVNDC